MRKESIEQMLAACGVTDINELFLEIPETVRTNGLELEPGLSEHEALTKVTDILSCNQGNGKMPVFLGGGLGHHYIPSAVRNIIQRSEIYTAYTPYQPEVSQGTLQALFEYQSFMAELTGMEVVNASMYDGATALAEAVILASTSTRKKEVLLPRGLDPCKREVVENQVGGLGIRVRDVPFEPDTGKVDLERLRESVNGDTAAIYVENPNFFGVLEDQVAELKEIAGKALLIVGVNPLSLALLKPPGEYGADIVVGDGQPFGNPLMYGGPHLGIFGCRKKLVRRMPGKLVGMTEDSNGRRAYAITLQTREQHIRRDKATSNICTNEALCAVAAAVHLSLMGSSGLRNVAMTNMANAKELARRINEVPGFKAPYFSSSHFNDFVVGYDMETDVVHRHLLSKGVHGGKRLDEWFPELGPSALFGVTEMHSGQAMDSLVSALRSIMEVDA